MRASEPKPAEFQFRSVTTPISALRASNTELSYTTSFLPHRDSKPLTETIFDEIAYVDAPNGFIDHLETFIDDLTPQKHTAAGEEPAERPVFIGRKGQRYAIAVEERLPSYSYITTPAADDKRKPVLCDATRPVMPRKTSAGDCHETTWKDALVHLFGKNILKTLDEYKSVSPYAAWDMKYVYSNAPTIHATDFFRALLDEASFDIWCVLYFFEVWMDGLIDSVFDPLLPLHDVVINWKKYIPYAFHNLEYPMIAVRVVENSDIYTGEEREDPIDIREVSEVLIHFFMGYYGLYTVVNNPQTITNGTLQYKWYKPGKWVIFKHNTEGRTSISNPARDYCNTIHNCPSLVVDTRISPPFLTTRGFLLDVLYSAAVLGNPIPHRLGRPPTTRFRARKMNRERIFPVGPSPPPDDASDRVPTLDELKRDIAGPIYEPVNRTRGVFRSRHIPPNVVVKASPYHVVYNELHPVEAIIPADIEILSGLPDGIYAVDTITTLRRELGV
jgi:hypothetical protein